MLKFFRASIKVQSSFTTASHCDGKLVASQKITPAMTIQENAMNLQQLKDRPADTEPAKAVVSVISRTRNSWMDGFDRHLLLDSVIGVGLGYAALTRDGKPVFEENGQDFEQLMTVAQAEEMAKSDPQHDWEIHLVALLDERHYRREGSGRWTLARRGYGLS
jgi:hypothetical protein